GLVVSSEEIEGDEFVGSEPLEIPFKKRTEKVVVIGSGPAGFFAAHVLQLAGFSVTIIERGAEVAERTKAIDLLESKGIFDDQNNYAFGEGGAGTFSDGKLTSRSKHISKERNFILSEYVKAGAPEEVLCMNHPHLGTDNLKLIVANLRLQFLNNGGVFLFDTLLKEVIIKGARAIGVITDKGDMEADHVVLATGHSAYDTYRMLIKKGIQFGPKNFAIGHRIEHPQELINKAQWGRSSLPGVKAAEYRLNTKSKSGLGVYTFCMCPGGMVVPAAAYKEKSVVNGMSYYQRDGNFANAGCVVGVHPDLLLGHECSALEILDWMDELEGKFFAYSNGYTLPANMAADYMQKRESRKLSESSYPLGVKSAPLFNMIPEMVRQALREGLTDFSRKLYGFDQGMLMGLESKTSSPIQAARDREGKCTGFDNLYFVGEGSGYAGGIISSAADGVKCAMAISTQ
ncbi:MAG: NAD(P)/FAD-dependent oxidoreductase, partial [Bacteroidales bacterium]|nr:NAD(P)/FAD-dependent oxidoreductase [Bacteroidales bacterium]